HLGSYVVTYLALCTTAFFTLSLHDALPILGDGEGVRCRSKNRKNSHDFVVVPDRGYDHGTNPQGADRDRVHAGIGFSIVAAQLLDRKSTRLNSSHVSISYAVFCLK